jgi:hypothetical protein
MSPSIYHESVSDEIAGSTMAWGVKLRPGSHLVESWAMLVSTWGLGSHTDGKETSRTD